MGVITYRKHESLKDSDKTVVFFTGFRTDDDEKYEWWSYKDLPVNTVFIRDISLTWYHACYEEILEYLKTVITEKTLMVGASAGGYAALVFANALGKKSLSLNPQTILGGPGCLIQNKKWGEYHNKVRRLTKNPELIDISWITGDNHTIYYSILVQIDKYNTERMKCKLYPNVYKDHGLAEYLQRIGELPKILDKEIMDL